MLAFVPAVDGLSGTIATSWRLTRLEGSGHSCEEAPSYTVTPTHPNVMFIGEPRTWPAHDTERNAAYVRIETPAPGAIRMRVGDQQTVASAGWCGQCDRACSDDTLTGYDQTPSDELLVDPHQPPTVRILSAPWPGAAVELIWRAE